MNKVISKEEYDMSGSWGLAMSLDLFDCNPSTIRDGDEIKRYLVELCELIDMKRFGEPLIVRFGANPVVQGYSAVQLIETSCISGHFAEDSDSVYMDVFSCKFYEQKAVIEFTEKFFGAKSFKANIVLRGEGIVK
jgi:S-adenosylmethionine/arginine decarboxylase-like enzyme